MNDFIFVIKTQRCGNVSFQ